MEAAGRFAHGAGFDEGRQEIQVAQFKTAFDAIRPWHRFDPFRMVMT